MIDRREKGEKKAPGAFSGIQDGERRKTLPSLRQAKPGKGGKAVRIMSWKPFVGTLRVRIPPGRAWPATGSECCVLVWVTHRTKRTQRVRKPCYRASKDVSSRSPRRGRNGGHADALHRPGAVGPAGVGEHGIGTGGFTRNLGSPARLPTIISGSGDRMLNPWPAVSVLDRWERKHRRSVGYRHAKATERGEREAGCRSTP
jgi:hypothetical protein